MDERTRSQIETRISGSPVVLFMKGNRHAPRCGFSAKVVQILDSMLPEYSTWDVLEDPALRDGIKEFSSWPTIPQLYIKGEFVGGCDIVSEMYEAGQLQEKIGVASGPAPNPKITVSGAAAEAFKGALGSPEEVIRLEVSASFEHALMLGPKQGGDILVETAAGTIALDRLSAARADGVSIDYVTTPGGPAFKIDNPNEPPRVRTLSVQELKAELDAKSDLLLIDVRTDQERNTASIAGSVALGEIDTKSLPKDKKVVLYCHHGVRSQHAAELLLSQGFKSVFNVAGGIDAWSSEVDPSVARY
jgi:monothiol glutaredoxin